jgi:hypothetical protein
LAEKFTMTVSGGLAGRLSCQPFAQRQASRRIHPPYGNDEACLLGQRHELGGAQEPPLRVPPAH